MTGLYYVVWRSGVQWRWSLYAGNHQMIANSGESYWNKSDCLAAIALVKNSASAPVVER